MAGHFVGHWKTPVARTPPLGGPGSPQNGKKNSAAGLGGNDVFKVVFFGGGFGKHWSWGDPYLGGRRFDVSFARFVSNKVFTQGVFFEMGQVPGGGGQG